MIFEDPSHRRWRRALTAFAALLLSVGCVVGLAVTGVLVPPPVPDPFSDLPGVRATKARANFEAYVKPTYSKKQQRRFDRIRAQERRRRERLLRGASEKALPLPEGSVVAFSLQGDWSSVSALERRIAQIDVSIPDWFALSGPGCDLDEHVDAPTRRVLGRASNVIVLPRLVNYTKGEWQSEDTRRFLGNDRARACLVKRLTERLVALRADGINVDFESLTADESEPFLEFLLELGGALHARGMRLTVDVALHNRFYDVEYIGRISDAVMVMAYDEHETTSDPGPVASAHWFAEQVTEAKARIPGDRIVFILGSYGYDWTTDGSKQAEGVGFRKAMDIARIAKAQPAFQPGAENTYFSYRDAAGHTHDLWFQDALATWNQMQTLAERHVSRAGLWRLGNEDPTLWRFLGAEEESRGATTLANVPPTTSMDIFGRGEVLAVRGEPQSGLRTIRVGKGGRVSSAVYSKVPSGYVVERRGGASKRVVLTFDDGPDPKWTPQVLDALRDLNVPATFFVVGDLATRHPKVVERTAAEGHLVGNHTFSHPHLEELTARERTFELNATQRLIEGLTGTRTPLFRPPYCVNPDPSEPAERTSVQAGFNSGYVYVGANVDSHDWKTPGADVIAKSVIEGVVSGQGRVVLLHDGGGNRGQTVDALRRFVPVLRAQGYKFVSLDQYLGVPRQEMARTLPLSDRLISWGNAAVARARASGWAVLAVLFFVSTVLSALRILFLGFLTLRNARKAAPIPSPEFEPLVSVLIPAYNEGKVIESTLRSILHNGYENIELLVIDDGSTDETAAVTTNLSLTEPRIRLLSQANAGKAAASNHGLREARGDIVLAVDADTLLTSGAIEKLARHFADPTVTAVCGNVEVGNVNSLLTAFQAIEYVTSQNFDRRAFASLNCISVVPGAIGAWRRQAMLDVGGYSHDTLAEDTDLTLTVLQAGGKVAYESEARARTEAPETLSAFLKQRFRWTYGSYQCLWKHRRAFFNGTLGWVGLPNMVMFQVLFPILSPIGDLVMVLAIWRGDWKAFVAGYVAFLLMDVCASVLAFILDGKPMRWLALLLVQRFSYRQLMYYISARAMIAALRGARHGWRKLDRTGTVKASDLGARLQPGKS